MTTHPSCLTCGSPVAPARYTGVTQTSLYCSTRCQRVREYARERAQRATERAETELVNARRDHANAFERPPKLTNTTQRIAFWEAEAERARQALADLL